MHGYEAFLADRASQLTGLSPRRIKAWNRDGVLRAQWPDNGRRSGPMFSFRDVVGLRALAVLRDERHIPLSKLRCIGPWLREHQESPLENLRIRVDGRHVCLEETGSDGAVTNGHGGGHGDTLELAAVAADLRERIEAARRRRPEDIGRVVRKRGVQGNVPILAGTRIPTTSVWSFHEAGYGVEQIIEEYPRLYPEDIQAAIDFERGRRAG